MTLKKQCDKLWSELIKKRAGYKSELSGRAERLHSHHIMGKPNYRLRFEVKNGICLTAGEHFYGVHNQGRQKDYEDKIRAVKGENIYEELNLLRHSNGKTDLKLVKLFLEQQLRDLK